MQIKKSVIFVLFLAMILALSGCGKKSEPQMGNGRINEQKENTASTTPVLGDGQVATNNFETTENGTSAEEIASSTNEVDASSWKTYKNAKYGFEISFPVNVAVDYSYWYCGDRKGKLLIPLEIFEDNKSFYLGESYYYIQDNCQKNKVDVSYIKKDNGNNFWDIQIVEGMDNDQILENFLKQRYGTGCKLGGKTKVDNNTYNISILGDGKDLGESKCPLNFWLTIKYDPIKKLIAVIDMGQECRFAADRNDNGKLDLETPDLIDCYDFDILKSFRFLN